MQGVLRLSRDPAVESLSLKALFKENVEEVLSQNHATKVQKAIHSEPDLGGRVASAEKPTPCHPLHSDVGLTPMEVRFGP